MEKNQINVNTIDGDFLCVQSFDCSEGDLIDIYDNDNNYVGNFHGNLEYFTEDELIEIVEDIMEDKNDLYFNDMDDGQWNFD